MRILVVDDSAFMRKAISQMIASDPKMEVVGTAGNGKEGVEKARELKPDVITLDIEMPVMDGLTALRHIMRDCPTQVLMFSSLTTEGSHAALRAMTLGAADFMAKDTSQISLDIMAMQEDLLTRLWALGQHRVKLAASKAGEGDLPVYRSGQFDVICIGSSTGGPPALETILSAIPASMRTPIVIAQHMPRMFTESLAQRLKQVCPMKVVHAQDGMAVDNDSVYIAPGGQHVHLVKQRFGHWQLAINDEPKEAPFRPSVNAFFSSAAAQVGRRTLAIVLTGIGEDGLVGAQELKAKGATILAQSAETCVVYGMPKAVTQQGLVAASLTPAQMGQVLARMAPPVKPAV